jgi:hypothetical protein
MLSIQQEEGELSGMLHGTTLAEVENIAGIHNRSARQLLLDIDPDETKRQIQLPSLVYQGVFDYPAPDDLKGDKVIDLYWQSDRNHSNFFIKTTPQNFDLTKNQYLNEFCVFRNSGVKTLRVSFTNATKSININSASSIVGNGTWIASGTAQNINQNNIIVDNGLPVIGFDLLAGTGYVTNSTMSPVDLTNHLNQSRIFWDIFIPLASSLTSVSIRFGSDADNYWEVSNITSGFSQSFINSKNVISALWASATKVGNPNITAITYIRLGFTASIDLYGMAFCNIWSKLGFVFNITYYSKFLFSDVNGIWKEKNTDPSDFINLDTDSYNLFVSQDALNCVQQALGQDAGYDTNFFSQQYENNLKRYKSLYKSEIQKKSESYYQKTFKGYSGWIGYNQNQI